MPGLDIPLVLAAEQNKAQLRLIELNSALLKAVTEKDGEALEFRSTGSVDGSEQSPPDTVLCTVEETYSIRQKNSSNSVYILQTTSEGVRAIAQVTSALEVSKRIGPSPALDFVRNLVPEYTSEDTFDIERALKRGPDDHTHRTPCCTEELVAAESDLAVTLYKRTLFLRPGPQKLVELLEELRNNALIARVDLSKILSTEQLEKLTDSMSTLDQDISRHILHAITPRDRGSIPEDVWQAKLQKLRYPEPQDQVNWIGRKLIEFEAPDTPVPTAPFVERWKDLLPERWRDLADTQLLEGDAILHDNGASIVCRPFNDPNDSTNDTSAGAAGKKRKWHEKFKASKR